MLYLTFHIHTAVCEIYNFFLHCFLSMRFTFESVRSSDFTACLIDCIQPSLHSPSNFLLRLSHSSSHTPFFHTLNRLKTTSKISEPLVLSLDLPLTSTLYLTFLFLTQSLQVIYTPSKNRFSLIWQRREHLNCRWTKSHLLCAFEAFAWFYLFFCRYSLFRWRWTTMFFFVKTRCILKI